MYATPQYPAPRPTYLHGRLQACQFCDRFCFTRVLVTLRASEAAAQCIVIAPVCLCLFVGLLPR